ncbi:MAG: DNA mismatch repair protein MutS [Verrucomicrobia bacterium]|nr:DNA mismatch repair protein MutS [Verrucomicrobiota bacterium]
MMTQYRRIKSELPKDALLMFRLGDFYEMFFEDALEASQILNIALTKRGNYPMCGIPYHAAEGYLSKLLEAGRKVAICDQMEDPKPGHLVKREVTQILSPGTHFDERVLSAERNNFLAAIYPCKQCFGLALADLTTGDFFVTEVPSMPVLMAELERQRPAEIVIPSEEDELRRALVPAFPHLALYEDWVFAPETSFYTLKDHFHVASLDGFGLRDRVAATGAAGAVIHYLEQHLRRNVGQLSRICFYERTDYLALDANTLRNLEILEPLNRNTPMIHSLFGVMNKTCTPMGARKLRGWLSQPLADVASITERQQAVRCWLDHTDALAMFRTKLTVVRDLERVLTRLTTVSGNARDMLALSQALEQLPAIKEIITGLKDDSALFSKLAEKIVLLPELVHLIQSQIVDEPPISTKEGGIIRPGADAQLDELREIMHGGKNWIARMQQEEIERTGIPSLKVRFNSVFGYYIEVTKTHLDKVPDTYIRKQTIVNGERFITPELKEWESKILGAEERVKRIEYDLFVKLREQVTVQLTVNQQNAQALAELDVLACFAQLAQLYGYICPVVKDEGILFIKDGRHPVLEQTLPAGRFVSNDTDLDPARKQIGIITGPNMAGKSTYIRQTALLTLMAQTGSFIPAKEARVDIVDRIFTRIGASDDIARGQSTFMVEMSETASILNNATSRSLVILDEIGRGTSTFDGLSLAWSIAEYLHNQCGAKTLFATHYHELTGLASRLERVYNLNVSVREWNDQIVFIHKISPGAADKSYGIHVARLAGIPASVLNRAMEVLSNLEETELDPLGAEGASGEGGDRPASTEKTVRTIAKRQKLRDLPDPNQLDLFSQLGL